MLIRSSYMWSQFCKKYKQVQAEPPVEGEVKTAAGIAGADTTSSYIAEQSAAAASAFLSASHKKGGVKPPTEGTLPLTSKGGGPLVFPTPSASGSRHVPTRVANRRHVKNGRSALGLIQDVLLGRD
jgi:hypothetical protein